VSLLDKGELHLFVRVLFFSSHHRRHPPCVKGSIVTSFFRKLAFPDKVQLFSKVRGPPLWKPFCPTRFEGACFSFFSSSSVVVSFHVALRLFFSRWPARSGIVPRTFFRAELLQYCLRFSSGLGDFFAFDRRRCLRLPSHSRPRSFPTCEESFSSSQS